MLVNTRYVTAIELVGNRDGVGDLLHCKVTHLAILNRICQVLDQESMVLRSDCRIQ